jgi:hypothetical protein
MRVINCKNEEEFAKYEEQAREVLGLPNAHFENYATVEESGMRFPVNPEVAHLFPAGLVVEYNGEDDEPTEEDDGEA